VVEIITDKLTNAVWNKPVLYNNRLKEFQSNYISKSDAETKFRRLRRRRSGSTGIAKVTRKPSYRKDNRAMRPIYGCPFRESWL